MDKFHDSPVARNIVTLNPCFQCAIIISYYYILLCVLIKIHPKLGGFNTTGTAFASNQTWHDVRHSVDGAPINPLVQLDRMYWVATSSLQIVLYVIACHHRSAWGPGVSWNPACCLRQAINDDVAANQWQQVSTNEIFRNRLPVVNMVVVFLCFCGCAWEELFVSPCIVVFSAGLWFLPFGRSHVSDVFIVVLSCHGAFRAPPSRPGSPRRWETPQKPVHISISKPV